MRRRGGGGPGGPAPAALPATALLARWHAQFSGVTESDGKVTQVNDLIGPAHATNGSGEGPLLMTDAAGRRFLRFNQTAWMAFITAAGLNSRALSCWFVGRHHQAVSTSFISMYGNTGAATLNASVSGSIAPFLRGHAASATAAASGKERLICGSQLQVLGVTSGTTAGGGQRLFVNESHSGDLAQATSQVQDGTTIAIGGEIGRYAHIPGASGTWAAMDMYEMVLYGGKQSNADAAATSAALMAAYGIAPIIDAVTIEGDSIHAGFRNNPMNPGEIPSGSNIAMQMAPPPATRVVNVASSGSTGATLLTRRDAANSIHQSTSMLLSGTNKLVVMVGRNDITTTPSTTAIGDAVLDAANSGTIALINTPAGGYLQRGYARVLVGVNIAVGSNIEIANNQIRTRLRAAQFLTDTLSGAGQSYEGKVGLVDYPAVVVSGSGTIFDTTADASDLGWYVTGFTHPNVAGTGKMAEAAGAALWT